MRIIVESPRISVRVEEATVAEGEAPTKILDYQRDYTRFELNVEALLNEAQVLAHAAKGIEEILNPPHRCGGGLLASILASSALSHAFANMGTEPGEPGDDKPQPSAADDIPPPAETPDFGQDSTNNQAP